MLIKVSEATKNQLNWLVAKCEGYDPQWSEVREDFDLNGNAQVVFLKEFDPTTNWSQGGPIIERGKIEVTPPVPEWCNGSEDKEWMATSLPVVRGEATLEVGPTPLIAAMRCYVMSRLGEEVEVPDELA